MKRVAVYAGTRNVYGQMVSAATSRVKNTRMDRVFFLIEDDALPEEICGPQGLPGTSRRTARTRRSGITRDV